jgi:hypothetical protein
VLLSDYARNSTIIGNDFSGVGDSAIVSLGRAQREVNGEVSSEVTAVGVNGEGGEWVGGWRRGGLTAR